jgi:hypothetical protein
VHPTIDPLEITNALGLKAQRFYRVGDRRVTPKGKLLEGVYPETRWRYSVQYSPSDQWFAGKVELLLDRLEPHKKFLRQLSDTGGKLFLIVQFLGDAYFSDNLPRSTLARIIDLGLGLGIERY